MPADTPPPHGGNATDAQPAPVAGGTSAAVARASGPEYVATFVLSLIFLGLFYALYASGAPPYFQSIVLVAGLTVVFTGLLRATGTFQGKGGTLGGAAAVFAVMFLVVEGARVLDQNDELKSKTAQLSGLQVTMASEKTSHGQEIAGLQEQIGVLKEQTEELALGIKLLRGPVQDRYRVETDQGIIEPQLGYYRVSTVMLDEVDGNIYVTADDEFGAPVDCFYLSYRHQPPKLVLYALESAGEKPCVSGR